ncbi:MAG: hypothetical protein KGJ38_02665 [Burkholderiaceae bacterium]|nr:hypothetical protein [Burkholderiaceae bacterium]
MPADKLGQFMKGAEFLRRCNAAIEKAVRGLETRGIKPVYSERQAGDVHSAEASGLGRGDEHQQP